MDVAGCAANDSKKDRSMRGRERHTVSLVCRVPARRDFVTTFLTKESTYRNTKRTISTDQTDVR